MPAAMNTPQIGNIDLGTLQFVSSFANQTGRVRFQGQWIAIDRQNNLLIDRYDKITTASTRGRLISKIKDLFSIIPIVSPDTLSRQMLYRLQSINPISGTQTIVDGCVLDGVVLLIPGGNRLTVMFDYPFVLPVLPSLLPSIASTSSNNWQTRRIVRLQQNKVNRLIKKSIDPILARAISENHIRILQISDLNTVLGQVGNGVAS